MSLAAFLLIVGNAPVGSTLQSAWLHFLLPAENRTNEIGRFRLPKFRANVATSMAAESVLPVKAIFFLRNGHTVSPRIAQLSPMQAIKPYLKSSFLLAFPKVVCSITELSQAIELSGSILEFKLRYKRSPPHFEELRSELVKRMLGA